MCDLKFYNINTIFYYMQSYYYLGMQRLQQNKLIQALQQFDKHKPFDDCVKPLIKYSFNQNINT